MIVNHFVIFCWKDALAFIIDLGSWMTDAEEEHESNLHISLACITRIVLRKVLLLVQQCLYYFDI